MLSSDSESEGAGVAATPVSSRSFSTSPSPSTSGRGSVGRPRKSLVWDYFTYDFSSNKSMCQVSSESHSDAEATSPISVCGHRITGKFTTNLRSHLKKSHTNCYKELVTKEESAKEEELRGKTKADKGRAGPVKQSTLMEVMQRKYDKTSSRWQDITRKMAMFIATSNVPNAVVENAEFRLLMETLDPRYQTPSRARMAKEMDLLMADMKGRIKVFLDSAQKVSACTDIWTKRGMTSSYLGVTAHFFSRHDHRRHCVTLAVRVFPHPHTADRIRSLLDEVLKEWDVDQKFYFVITDSGSNMVKAFRSDVLASITDYSEGSMDEDVGEANSGDDAEDEDEDFDVDEDNDFDTKEMQHDIVFSQCGKRLACFAHSLQLVVQKFKDDSLKPLMKKVYALVKKVNKSSRATGILLSLCNKKLVTNVPTRWSSTFLLLDRLLDVKGPLSTALDQLEWDNLAHSEWKTIEMVHKLLKPFAQYTALISGEEYTTLSSVIPILMELQLHLQDMVQVPEVASVATTLRSELNRRFRKYTDPGDEDFEPIYVVSTLLDPRYKPLINAVQMKSGKDELLRMLKVNDLDSQSSSQSSPIQSSPTPLPEEESPVKKRQRFSYLSKVLEEKLRQGKEKAAREPHGKQELERYLDSVPSLGDDDDPLVFWVEQKDAYPLLSTLAADIMCAPASSAAVERIFSTAGEATTGKRNKLTHKNLEREVLIRRNKEYMYT